MTQTITLRCTEGSSDKVYTASVTPDGDGYHVDVRYGRFGSSLTHQRKTSAPLALEAATKQRDKLVAEKLRKGYVAQGEGAKAIVTGDEGRATGELPMLLNPVEECEVERLLASEDWLMQPKLDGRRALLIIDDGKVTLTNRRGLAVAVPESIAMVAKDFIGDGRLVLDGELIGDTLHVFDLLMVAGTCLRNLPLVDRLNVLHARMVMTPACLKVVPTYRTTAQKRDALDVLIAQNAEGVVFKHVASLYTVGRPNSGGAALKYKFIESATVIVTGLHPAKRSVSMGLLDVAGNVVEVGNVTIPPNYPVPAVGALAEVEYLYAYRGGSLFQPVYRGERRSDLTRDDAVIDQLKYKADAEAA